MRQHGTMTSRALGVLVLDIALINVWNRLNITTKQVAGDWAKSAEAKKWLPEAVQKAS
jgi:hypothetical protein